MLHRQNREFDTHHAADFARPQAAAIHHMLGLDDALFRDDVPSAIRILCQFLHRVAQHDLRAEFLRRLGIGDRRAGRVEMSFDRIPHGADEILLVHQRKHRLRLCRRDQFRVHAEVTALGVGDAQEVHALRRVGHHHAAGPVQQQDWPETSSSSL